MPGDAGNKFTARQTNWMRDILDQYAERIPGAIAQAIDESDGLVRQELATKMKQYVRQRIGHVREVLPPSPPQGPVSAPLPPTPITGGPAAGGSGDTWVSEHRRDGRIIKGYWRKRPGR